MIETIKFSEAIRSTFHQMMKKNKNIILIGLGTNDPKGIFGTTAGLSESFGTNRVIEPPTSEAALTGICIGAAVRGLRPVLSHQRVEFSLLSLEQIINQAAKWNFMSGGKQKSSFGYKIDNWKRMGSRSTTLSIFGGSVRSYSRIKSCCPSKCL